MLKMDSEVVMTQIILEDVMRILVADFSLKRLQKKQANAMCV